MMTALTSPAENTIVTKLITPTSKASRRTDISPRNPIGTFWCPNRNPQATSNPKTTGVAPFIGMGFEGCKTTLVSPVPAAATTQYAQNPARDQIRSSHPPSMTIIRQLNTKSKTDDGSNG